MFQYNPFTGTLDLNSGPGSYTDDVVEYANLAAFPVPGEEGKIYVDRSRDRAYRWPENGTTLESYREVSGPEVTQAELASVQQSLSNLSGSAYKPTTTRTTIDSNTGTEWLYGGFGRAENWIITFSVSRAVTISFNPNPAPFNPPILGDYVNVSLLTSGNSVWTANFVRPDGSPLFSATSADSDLKKSNLRFVYDGTAWKLDKTVWTPELQSLFDSKLTRTDVQGGGSSFFERSGNATSQNVGQGQSVHQLVLANDTRLTDARRVQWFPAPATPGTVPNDAAAGSMAYDGSFLYLLVSYSPPDLPAGFPPLLRWARTPLSMTW